MRKNLFAPIVLAILGLFACTTARGDNPDNNETKLSRKELKEKYGLSSVKKQYGDNGFWYYLVSKNEDGQKLYGVIDQNDSLIIDCHYEDIVYISGIPEKGYYSYPITSMAGGTDMFRIYNNAMPHHFILDKAQSDDAIICSCDGKTINTIRGEVKYLGSWLIINPKSIYTRNLDGFLRLMLINNESKDMGLMTWDGKEIFKNENYLIYITSKLPSTYNNAYAFNSANRAGGVFLEDQGTLVPTEYAEIRTIYNGKKFEVKLSPADKFHVYNKENAEKFIPKNPGEQFYLDHKYDECIKYYADAGVNDPDSKMYSAAALYAIADLKVIALKNHLEAPSANKLKDYDYKETKTILDNAKTILQTAISQDSARAGMYKELISNCDKKAEELNSYNSELKENSFGNKLLKSVLAGLSEGLKQAALKSVTSLFTSGSGNSSTPTPSTATSQPARVQSGSTPTSESKSLSSNVQNRIRQVEKNIENETRYLENAEKRYNSNPSSAAKREIDAHKRAIEGYKRQIEELKK